MDDLLETFEIGRSLSMKGCPYDNAVAEATYKVMKTEFMNKMEFQNLEQSFNLNSTTMSIGLTNTEFMEHLAI